MSQTESSACSTSSSSVPLSSEKERTDEKQCEISDSTMPLADVPLQVTETEQHGSVIGKSKIVIIDANFKLELLNGQWNGMILITFDSGFERYNHKSIFPLADPSTLRCSLHSILCACEICAADLQNFERVHIEDPTMRFVILSTNRNAVDLIKSRNARTSKRYLVRTAAKLFSLLPTEYFALEYARGNDGEEGNDEDAEKSRQKKKAAKKKAKFGSIMDANSSLMETHRVIFENPKQQMSEEKKKKKKKQGNGTSETLPDESAEKKKEEREKKQADEIKERTVRVREQMQLLTDLMSVGTPGSSGCRRRCKKPLI